MTSEKRKPKWSVIVPLVGLVVAVLAFVLWPRPMPFTFLEGAETVAFRVYGSADDALEGEHCIRIYEVDSVMLELLTSIRKELPSANGWFEREFSADPSYSFENGDQTILVFPHPTDKNRTAIMYDHQPTGPERFKGRYVDNVPDRYQQWQ